MIAMTIDWQGLLSTVSISGLGLAAATYLIKTALSHSLTRDAERFRVQLTAEANAQIESLKSTLEMAAVEHQVRFSSLHAKRAEVIAAIYEKAFEIELVAQNYIMLNSFGEQSPEGVQAYNDTQFQLSNFYNFVETRKIYLSEHVCSL